MALGAGQRVPRAHLLTTNPVALTSRCSFPRSLYGVPPVSCSWQVIGSFSVSHKNKKNDDVSGAGAADTREAEVRIIGGTFRGRRLQYHGDPLVRPMKNRTRESLFNLI